MNKNVRTGLALLCIALIGLLLFAVAGEDNASLRGVAGALVVVFGVIGLVSVAVGLVRQTN